MDFIERWFGVSPDGGDGTAEVLYLCAAAAIVCLLLTRKHLTAIAQRWLSKRVD